MINGRALILRVVDIASKLIGKDCVFVATDADEIDRLVKDNGFQSIMTSPDNLTGTDRVAEAAKYVNSDIIINIQGDEPMIEIADIQRVIDAKMAKPNMVANAYCRLNKGQDPVDVNIPKSWSTKSTSCFTCPVRLSREQNQDWRRSIFAKFAFMVSTTKN